MQPCEELEGEERGDPCEAPKPPCGLYLWMWCFTDDPGHPTQHSQDPVTARAPCEGGVTCVQMCSHRGPRGTDQAGKVEERESWVCQQGQARGQGGQGKAKEAVPGTTTGWHRRPRWPWAGGLMGRDLPTQGSVPQLWSLLSSGQGEGWVWACVPAFGSEFLPAHSLIQPHSLHGILLLLRHPSPRGGAAPVCTGVCWELSAAGRGRADTAEQKREILPVQAGRAEEGEVIRPVTWLSWAPQTPVSSPSTCRHWRELSTCQHCVLSAGPHVAAQSLFIEYLSSLPTSRIISGTSRFSWFTGSHVFAAFERVTHLFPTR